MRGRSAAESWRASPEVADIFRTAGPTYRSAHKGHLPAPETLHVSGMAASRCEKQTHPRADRSPSSRSWFREAAVFKALIDHLARKLVAPASASAEFRLEAHRPVDATCARLQGFLAESSEEHTSELP